MYLQASVLLAGVQFCRGDNERREGNYSRREDKYEATGDNFK